MGKNDLSAFEEPEYKGTYELKENEKQKENVVGGRPKKKAEDKKTKLVKVYLTPIELKKFEDRVKKEVGFKIPLGQYMRKILEDSDLI